MKNKIIYRLVIPLLLFSGCSSSVRIFTDVDETARFEKYATYNFLEFSEGNKKTIPEMELERTRVAIARELEKRGLAFVEDNSDVSVKVTLYHREAVHSYYGNPLMYNYMERAIAVDMYDNRTRKHVWHCAAVGELEYDAAERAKKLPEVAAEIFSRYPVSETNGLAPEGKGINPSS